MKNYDALYKDLPSTQKMIERQARQQEKDKGKEIFDASNLMTKNTVGLQKIQKGTTNIVAKPMTKERIREQVRQNQIMRAQASMARRQRGTQVVKDQHIEDI